MTSAVSEGLVLELILFNIFVGAMDCGIECALGKFANSTNLYGGVDTLEGRGRIQRDLDMLERRAQANFMEFKAKCKVLHLGWGSPKAQIQAGGRVY